jgi:trans-2,3-dihydro-3-hydroxyanthranilate isomerase
VLACTVTASGGTVKSATVQGAVVPIASGRIRVP